jgi:uncharacterized protein
VIENTFIHIQGIGPGTEKGIWQQGIKDWDGFLSHRGTVTSQKKDALIRMELEASRQNRHNIGYFADRLPVSETWRLFGAFKKRAAYLDIETSGEMTGNDLITVIGLYDGEEVHSFINGRNLQAFEAAVSAFDLLITFNGAGFDLPIIRRHFPGISLPPGHIDLRFLLNRLGYRGGLKRIEKTLGISRDSSIDGMDGLDAIRLWNAYTWGDRDALDLLIRYNAADILNLKPLMEYGYKRMRDVLMDEKIPAGQQHMPCG